MYTHHKFDHEFDGPETRSSYMVCAVPRSGSSLLCELLCLTELAGAPTEFLDPELMREFSGRWDTVGLDAYLEALMARKTSPNGVFGIKVHWPQLEEAFAGEDRCEVFPELRFVYITRGDRLRQAVSYARALQTGRWASEHDARREDPTFNPNQIRRLLSHIREHEERWEEFFARRAASPLRVSYEDLVASPEATVKAVLRHIGVEVPGVLPLGPPTLEKQADSLSEDWVRRFRELDPTGAHSR